MTKILLHCRTLDAYIYCKIVTTQGKYNYEPTAYGFQKDSPFLPLFNYYLNVIKEKGNVEQILRKYEPPPQICPNYSGKSLGFSSVFAAFGVLFFGVGIAVILFGLEKLSQAFGMKWSIFNSYGVVDHPDEFDGNDTTALIAEIDLLENQILVLKKRLESP